MPFVVFVVRVPSPVNLTNKVALITGGKRIGAVVARELAARGVDVALSYARSKTEAEEAAAACARPGGRRATFARRSVAARAAARAGAVGRRHVRPPRHPDQHGVGLRAEAVRRADRRRLGRRRSTSICAPRFSARTPPRRTCASRAAGASSTSATGSPKSGRPRYHGLSAVLRRQGRHHRADRSAGARARRRQHSRQRDRARTDRRAAGHDRRRSRSRRARRRRSGAGAARCEIAKAVLALLDSDFITGETHPRRRRPAREVSQARAVCVRSVRQTAYERRTAASSTRARRSVPCDRARSRSARSPRRSAPKSTPGTQPMRPFLIRYSTIRHDDGLAVAASRRRVDATPDRFAGTRRTRRPAACPRRRRRPSSLDARVEQIAPRAQLGAERLDAVLRTFERADAAELHDRRDVARRVEQDLLRAVADHRRP